MNLEVKVNEKIIVADSIEDVVRIIEDEIMSWSSRDGDDAPLQITVSKVKSRAPPALGVNVSDGVGANESLGP